ncbi:MAG: hypothetical protein CL940_12065 [Deltaproteobacteria bacterium]|nr:hypothetical protein [Deltaproteobacteria bacterium]
MDRTYRLVACTLACAMAHASADSVALASAPSAAHFADQGALLGLPGLVPDTIVPAWIDIDLDGDEEPIWFAEGLVTSVDSDLSVHPVGVPDALGTSAGRPDPVGCAMDVDGDGVRELLIVGRELLVLDVSAPYTLTRREIPNPALPPATVLDIACGDLNSDGLPDAVLGLGIYSSERTENLGFPDYALMNLGHGRFEIGKLEPSQEGFTQGIVLADMDDDGRADVVESMDFSMISGLSRVLYNRTPAGAQWPVFEVGVGVFDTGTCGMGAAVEDLNADGQMDIYNSSLGVDQLAYGRKNGSFDDVTFELGFRHLWGLDGWRDQWSPTIADLNLDGRLDVLVRHGGVAGQLFPIEGPNIAKRVADLLYLQREDGTFERVDTPFPDAALSHGRHAVLGDLEGDGKPDVALGGRKGSATFWTNETPSTGRVLTVRLYPTLSGDPAVGARAVAQCSGVTLTRSLTSGGKMGGSPAAELYFAWPECSDTVSLQVAWPAGGLTELEAPEGQTRIDAHEARWFEPSEQNPGHLLLDPNVAGASSACLVDAQDDATCCDAASGPCELELPESTEVPWRVLLPGKRPVAIHAGYRRWSLVVEPRPLRPGAPAIVHLRHVGDPSLLDPDEVFLLALGDTVPLEDKALDARVLSAELLVPSDASEVELKLWPDVFDEPWIVPTGGVFDSRWTSVDSYPYQVTGGVTEFWQWGVFVAGIRGMEYADAVDQIQVEGLDGVSLESSIVVNPQTAGRAKVLVDWGLIGDRETLRLNGGPSGVSYDIPVHSNHSLESAVAAVDSVFGGLIMPRMIANGDVSHVFFVLKDSQGGVLPPEEDVVLLEMDRGQVLTQPTLIGGGYTYLAVVQSSDEVGTGQVRARLSDGRELAAWSFENRAPDGTDFDGERSTASLSAAEEPGLYRLDVQALSRFDEALGADAKLSVAVEGGALLSGPQVTPEGVAHEAVIEVDPTASNLRVELSVDGVLFRTIEEPLVPSERPRTAEDVRQDLAAQDATSGVEDLSASPVPPRDDGGCASGALGGGDRLPLLLLVALALIARARRRLG